MEPVHFLDEQNEEVVGKSFLSTFSVRDSSGTVCQILCVLRGFKIEPLLFIIDYYLIQRQKLCEELEKRGMKKSGSKTELISLLEKVWPIPNSESWLTKCVLCKKSVDISELKLRKNITLGSNL